MRRSRCGHESVTKPFVLSLASGSQGCREASTLPYAHAAGPAFATHGRPAREEVRMPDFPPFRLDPSNQCLWRLQATARDERILLPHKAFAVLRYLVEHAGRLVTQEELLEAVWPETYIKPEVLKSRIFEIRSALGDRPKTPRFIETLPRRGYRFIAPVHDSPTAAPALPRPPASSLLVGRAG